MRVKSKMAMLVALVLAALMVACQSSNQQQQSEETPDAGTAATGKAAKKGAKGAKAEAPAPQTVTLTVPEGTTLSVRLGDTLDTGKVAAGATFQGTLAAALTANGQEVAPIGSAVTGKVTNAVSSGRLNRPAELGLTLTSLAVGGQTQDITTSTWSEKGESHKKRNLELIGGGGGVGALVGALAGGKKGAAIGGAVGAGAGAGGAAYTGKKEIVLATETKLEFKLTAPVSFTFQK